MALKCYLSADRLRPITHISGADKATRERSQILVGQSNRVTTPSVVSVPYCIRGNISRLASPRPISNEDIGSINAEIINNLAVNVIENSYGKPYVKLDVKHFKALRKSRLDNYRMIYNYAASSAHLDTTVRPMMAEVYGQLLDDLKNGNRRSPIFNHHIDYVNAAHYKRDLPYEDSDPHDIVVDYIASMTDNYFIELHGYLFPNSPLQVQYKGYFDE